MTDLPRGTDVVVVGRGVVGLAFARVLAAGLDVVLLEAASRAR